ncbi:Chromosome transmission fidelity protein 18 [Conoideocrella luteorostrata]|uniref:Chromosome transmission fidelity protein 18 n=1 Tax=Conoideocrella luteorostrata TaxID=1105319 RepID=A0AAJ0CML9_9HYPO|nr:Chromosome transmission fidelity protein 18 [Conoideocrella luteorostrata]
MLSASSPVAFPQRSPTASKRSTPHEPQSAKPKHRVNGPFILDDDESDDESQDTQEDSHIAKKRMLQHHSEIDGALADGTQGTATKDEDDETQTNNPNSTPVLPSLGEPPVWSTQQPLFSSLVLDSIAPPSYTARTCCGKSATIKQRKATAAVSYESIVAARSRTKEGRAKRSYYGIDIHDLISSATKEIANKPQTVPNEPDAPVISIEAPVVPGRPKKTLLWTEKYRARKFVDLCGDDSTNRHVLRWLKRWDPVVFPGQAKAKPIVSRRPGMKQHVEEEKPHRKILMLTGPPGLGKTTLAHVCAKQAGYEVLEVNASDDRSRDVVKNRIRTSLGTESVKSVSNSKKSDGSPKLAKPVCVIVDEVDGVVSGSGASGEGGFVKALIDLVLTDQKNAAAPSASTYENSRKKKKGDDFRLLRPLILICNDVYHPSLRPLRQSNLAEIIHVGRPSLDTVVGRVKSVFEKEGIPCDKDAARKLCEAAWGMTSGIDAKRGAESTVEGDLRGVMVVGEWVAGRFKSSPGGVNSRLTRQWIQSNILHDLSSSAAGARGLGRGNVRDIVQRLFQEGGGFPKQAMDLSESKTRHEQPQAELGFGEQQKKHAMDRLRQMVDTSGEISTIMTEIFAEYPNREFNDDIYLTKPNQAYDWLHFHDSCQSRLYTSQDWELAPYLSQPVLACHHLFASPKKHYTSTGGFDKRWNGGQEAEDDGDPPLPFSGPRADYQARETEKQNRSQLQALQAQLSPTLTRSFRSPEDIATEFLPYLIRLVSPDVKPVVVGGSLGSMASVRKETEKIMVKRASEVLAEVGITLQKGKIESETIGGRGPQFVYRLEPDIDSLSAFESGTFLSALAPTRYAVRQVLDQELALTIALRENNARQARFRAGAGAGAGAAHVTAPMATDNKENLQGVTTEAKEGTLIKRDFFGRIIEAKPLAEIDGNIMEKRMKRKERKVWVTYHEGLNNAVRKPISLEEFLKVF